jgi:SAM-dependent methyltransferase
MFSLDKEKKLNANLIPASMPAGIALCRRWYATPSGQNTLVRVQGIVDSMTSDIFGYYALETGALAGKYSFLQKSRITSQFALGSVEGEASNLVASPEHLPIAFGDVDLVVASHVLDCSAQPHQILREMERVLVAEGHCILIGFNPFSLRGIGQLRYLPRYRSAPCHFYSTFRVRDWLSVLGFDVLETVSTGFCPLSLGKEESAARNWLTRWGDKYHFATGNVYIIHAQKKVSNMTPLLPLRKTKPVLRPGIIVNPGIGRISQNGQKNVKKSD